MKIVLLTGVSGCGKSSIAKLLSKNNKYNLVYSYTDRPKRDEDDVDHTFVDSNYMDLLLERSDIVAQTTINEYRYCTIKSQFDEDKINLYIVDVYGINDTINTFPSADIMTVLVRREDIEIDCLRQRRDVCIPAREDVDFLIDNNSTIELAASTLNTLVSFDLFKKPSHTTETLESKLEYVNQQYRYLNEIKKSLQEQLWYKYHPLYVQMCHYIEECLNQAFDFTVTINPDDEPYQNDGDMIFHIVVEYSADIPWTITHRLVEQASCHAHTFLKDYDCNFLSYNLLITDNLIDGEDDDYV